MTLDGSIFGRDQPCFGCSPTHPHGFHMTFERDGDSVTTRFTPGPDHQGPPGVMHGGLVATLADELAAWAIVVLREKFGFTAEMQARFTRPVRTGVELTGRSRIARDGRRVVRVAVELVQSDAVVFQAEVAFVLLDRGGAEKLLGGPIPEEWRRYCR